jgi:hypothetical protein
MVGFQKYFRVLGKVETAKVDLDVKSIMPILFQGKGHGDARRDDFLPLGVIEPSYHGAITPRG